MYYLVIIINLFLLTIRTIASSLFSETATILRGKTKGNSTCRGGQHELAVVRKVNR